MNAVLDACAMIAYLRSEPGSDLVESLLLDPDVFCYVHAVNLVEIYYDFLRKADASAARQAMWDLQAVGIIVRRDLNASFRRSVGALKARGRISLADCFCIALAQQINGEVVTSDHHEFDPLVPLNLCPFRFIR